MNSKVDYVWKCAKAFTINEPDGTRPATAMKNPPVPNAIDHLPSSVSVL